MGRSISAPPLDTGIYPDKAIIRLYGNEAVGSCDSGSIDPFLIGWVAVWRRATYHSIFVEA